MSYLKKHKWLRYLKFISILVNNKNLDRWIDLWVEEVRFNVGELLWKRSHNLTLYDTIDVSLKLVNNYFNARAYEKNHPFSH